MVGCMAVLRTFAETVQSACDWGGYKEVRDSLHSNATVMESVNEMTVLRLYSSSNLNHGATDRHVNHGATERQINLVTTAHYHNGIKAARHGNYILSDTNKCNNVE